MGTRFVPLSGTRAIRMIQRHRASNRILASGGFRLQNNFKTGRQNVFWPFFEFCAPAYTIGSPVHGAQLAMFRLAQTHRPVWQSLAFRLCHANAAEARIGPLNFLDIALMKSRL